MFVALQSSKTNATICMSLLGNVSLKTHGFSNKPRSGCCFITHSSLWKTCPQNKVEKWHHLQTVWLKELSLWWVRDIICYIWHVFHQYMCHGGQSLVPLCVSLHVGVIEHCCWLAPRCSSAGTLRCHWLAPGGTLHWPGKRVDKMKWIVSRCPTV